MAAVVGQTFADLGLSADLVGALGERGIVEPFAIQQLALADGLAGRDVCGKAKTGSGKTLAFGLPLLERVRALGPAAPGHPQALVLVPTRELAVQVTDVLAPLGHAIGEQVSSFYGGTSMDQQIKALRTGVDVAIATPGRLIDLGERGELSVSGVQVLVLDEADRMADMGFMPQVEWVLRRLTHDHQTLLFSATLDGDVDQLVKRYLKDPVRHEVESSTVTVEEMEHRFLAVHQLDKPKVAASIIRGAFKTLVFVRTKRGADRLTQQLRREGVKAAAIHGDLRQGARERALSDFAEGKLPALVATDVAARGLHIEGVDIVIHYDPPEDHKSYLHRSGRTARAGEAGIVVTLVLWDQHLDVERIQKRIGVRMPIVEVFSNDERLRDLAAWRPGEDAA
ncbi:MAG: helicase, superfamily [Acidimicrobiales bacterium]|nr:helicase, superfamily [Acidimicrobiales bacterium]